MTDPSIFAMVCEQRDKAMTELAAAQRIIAAKDEALDALARVTQDANDGLARRELAIGIRAVSAMMKLLAKHTWAADERHVADAVKAWLVENGARLHGDEAVYAAAEAHGTAVRR